MNILLKNLQQLLCAVTRSTIILGILALLIVPVFSLSFSKSASANVAIPLPLDNLAIPQSKEANNNKKNSTQASKTVEAITKSLPKPVKKSSTESSIKNCSPGLGFSEDKINCDYRGID